MKWVQKRNICHCGCFCSDEQRGKNGRNQKKAQTLYRFFLLLFYQVKLDILFNHHYYCCLLIVHFVDVCSHETQFHHLMYFHETWILVKSFHLFDSSCCKCYTNLMDKKKMSILSLWACLSNINSLFLSIDYLIKLDSV